VIICFRSTVYPKSNFRSRRIIETVADIQCSFDLLLPSQLLFWFEKPCYDMFSKKSVLSPSHTFGFPHLLRMFLRLGYVLPLTSKFERRVTRGAQFSVLEVFNILAILALLKYMEEIKPNNLPLAYTAAPFEYKLLFAVLMRGVSTDVSTTPNVI